VVLVPGGVDSAAVQGTPSAARRRGRREAEEAEEIAMIEVDAGRDRATPASC